jgi:hypothetical protein
MHEGYLCSVAAPRSGGHELSLLRSAAELPVGTVDMDTVLTHLASGALRVELHELDGLEATRAVHQELAEGRGSGKRVIRVAAGPTSAPRS